MATQNIEGAVTLEELMVSSLAMVDTRQSAHREGADCGKEFMTKLLAERANYQALLQKSRR